MIRWIICRETWEPVTRFGNATAQKWLAILPTFLKGFAEMNLPEGLAHGARAGAGSCRFRSYGPVSGM